MRAMSVLVLCLTLAPSAARGQDTPDTAVVEEPVTEDESATDTAAVVYVLERVAVRGRRRTADHVVRRLLPFREGEPLNVDDERLEQARYQLLGTGYFDAVELSIERGREPGRVVLVVVLRERNTLLLEEIAIGVSEGLNGEREYGGDVYVGATLAETNLFGSGTTLEGSAVVSLRQHGVRMRFFEPRLFGSPLALTVSGFFLNAREVYGDDDVLVTPIAPGDPGLFGPEDARFALVKYHRGGGAIGTGAVLDANTRFHVSYQLEVVDVLSRPDAASERRGSEVVPIDFALHDSTSFITMLTLAVSHDDRDTPSLTRRGRYLSVRADLANRLLGGDYDFFRAQAVWREWVPLPEWEHSLRFTLFVGAALGDVPVFYHFYAADLSDLQPSRMLELNLDRRSPPNVLGTSIAEHRFADLAARADVEYGFLIARLGEGVRAIWGFAGVGLYALADTNDFAQSIPGYAVSVPIDLTFDFGIRLDTPIGLFQIAFSTLLGFITL